MKKRISLNEHMLQHIICEAVKKVVGNELEEQDLNRYIKKSHIRMLEKFKQDLEEFRKETEEEAAVLYENTYTTFTLANIRLENGCLVYEYNGRTDYDQVVLYDEDSKEYYEDEYYGIADSIKFWRACLRRAKKYWEMDCESLDTLTDRQMNGETEDDEDDIINEAKKPQLISPSDAAEMGFGVDPRDMAYQDGEFVEPKNVGIAYKVFFLGKDGKLYPPVIANDDGQPTNVGEWLLATSPNIIGYTLKDHRPQVQSGGKGTRGRSLGALAFRPGWHMGEIPYAEQFMLKKTYNGRKIWPKELVWAECEYSNDVNYQEEAMSYGYSKTGKFRHSYAGLPKIPKNGSYRYRTNPNPNTVPWIISGAMRVKRLLSFNEVDEILREQGIEPPIPLSSQQIKQMKKELKKI